jgi:integrase
VLFLYRHVLGISLDEVSGIVRASARRRLPVVLTRREVSLVMAHFEGPPWLVVSLLYGAGLRLLEALELRVKDMDLERREITVREGRTAGR